LNLPTFHIKGTGAKDSTKKWLDSESKRRNKRKEELTSFEMECLKLLFLEPGDHVWIPCVAS